VFGFAVTLLIISLEVPHTSTELLHMMRGFVSFVITFIMLAGMWYAQFTFFRRYGLEDRVTVVLNLVLLFTVLFFVYPLKFLFGVLLSDPRMRSMVETAHGTVPAVLPEHKKWIFLIFGLGFMSVFLVFTLLYRHAYKQRDRLGLNEFEIYETKHSIRRMTLAMFIGVSYFAVAALQALPQETQMQKRIALGAGFAMLAVFATLMFLMARIARERKRVTKEWQARMAVGTQSEDE